MEAALNLKASEDVKGLGKTRGQKGGTPQTKPTRPRRLERAATCAARGGPKEPGPNGNGDERTTNVPEPNRPEQTPNARRKRLLVFCPDGHTLQYLCYTGRRPDNRTDLMLSCPAGYLPRSPAKYIYKPDAEREDSATCYQARARPGSRENSLPGVRPRNHRTGPHSWRFLHGVQGCRE